MKSIVLALDSSSQSVAAAKLFARLPFSGRPKLTVVTALVDTPYDRVTDGQGHILREAELEQARKVFAEVKSELEKQCDVDEHVIEREHPNDLILRVAEKVKSDAIVLGCSGHSAVYRVLVGSTAEHIANYAKCSVLLVRTNPSEGDIVPEDEWNILVAYDGSNHAQLAYQQVQEFDWPSDKTRIHVAMMLDRPKLHADEQVYDPQLVESSEEQVAKAISQANLSCPVTKSVRETLHVGSALRAVAESHSSSLVFAGQSAKSALGRFFLGSTSRYLLHHANSSLWLAKNKTW